MDATGEKDNAAFLVIVVSFLILLVLSIVVFGQPFVFPARVYTGG